MLTWPAGTKVFVCTRATDMRCGFDTRAAQVTRFLDQDPLSGHLFVSVRRFAFLAAVAYSARTEGASMAPGERGMCGRKVSGDARSASGGSSGRGCQFRVERFLGWRPPAGRHPDVIPSAGGLDAVGHPTLANGPEKRVPRSPRRASRP